MLAYTFGIPLSIFAFLLVGALFGTAGPDPNAGLMPGFIAACAVFAGCMSLQKKANNALEHPEAIMVNCSPERAFTSVYETLVECHASDSYWSLQPLQNSLKIVATLRFSEMLCAGESLKPENRFIRLVVTVRGITDGKTMVNLSYYIHSPHGRWTCDEGVRVTTAAIKRDLMAA